MKTLLSFLLLVGLVLGPIGCQSTGKPPSHPQAIAKQELQGIATTVDVAMKVWARYVVLSGLSAEKQEPVKNAHDRYRQAMASVKVVVEELRANPVPGGYDNATRIVDAASKELITLIYSYTEVRQ